MQYEKYTFWLLLVFAVSASAAAYWAHKKVSEVESTLTEKLKKVEVMGELVTSSIPDLQQAATTLEGAKTLFQSAGFGDPQTIIDLVDKLTPKPPPILSAQPMVATTRAPTVTYRIGRA
jgi:hypothetical protein